MLHCITLKNFEKVPIVNSSTNSSQAPQKLHTAFRQGKGEGGVRLKPVLGLDVSFPNAQSRPLAPDNLL